MSAELERLTLLAIRREYKGINADFFEYQLRQPPLSLVDTTARLGAWTSHPRGIELSRALLSDQGWGVLVEVLKHEMAHQYVDEVLKVTGEGPHGPSFRQVCQARGFDARSAGVPRTAKSDTESKPEQERVLDKIAKLLALAESANQHEAESAAQAAQGLMLKYNLDWVSQGGQARAYSFRQVGRATGRVSEHERWIAIILNEHFFVECIWVPVWRSREGKKGSVLEISGTETNLDIAAYVYDFLLQTGERLWRDPQKAKKISGNRDRRAFLAGVMLGFEERLQAQQVQHQEAGLVWSGDPELRAYYRQRHPRVSSVRTGLSGSWEARAEGRAAGRELVLRRGVSEGPGVGRPKLLGR